MHTRLASAVLASVLLVTASARADDRDAGVVLTATASSLVIASPITALIGYAISSANPTDGGIMAPFAIASFASGCLGLGMLAPGIVLLATSKQASPPRKEPTWVGPRWSAPALRALTFPLISASF